MFNLYSYYACTISIQIMIYYAETMLMPLCCVLSLLLCITVPFFLHAIQRCIRTYLLVSSTETDFVGDMITSTLAVAEPGVGPDRRTNVIIPIVNDPINEHQETFVMCMEIAEAVDRDRITLGRSVTQLIINDDDSMCITHISLKA